MVFISGIIALISNYFAVKNGIIGVSAILNTNFLFLYLFMEAMIL
jgi:hypothetical protein